jgi:hypothetical protein
VVDGRPAGRRPFRDALAVGGRQKTCDSETRLLHRLVQLASMPPSGKGEDAVEHLQQFLVRMQECTHAGVLLYVLYIYIYIANNAFSVLVYFMLAPEVVVYRYRSRHKLSSATNCVRIMIACCFYRRMVFTPHNERDYNRVHTHTCTRSTVVD